MTHQFYSIPTEQEHVMTKRRLTRTVPQLRELREARLLSQNMLAERAGITRPTVQRIEYGHPADASTIHKLARALDVTPHELVMDREEGNDRGGTQGTDGHRSTGRPADCVRNQHAHRR